MLDCAVESSGQDQSHGCVEYCEGAGDMGGLCDPACPAAVVEYSGHEEKDDDEEELEYQQGFGHGVSDSGMYMLVMVYSHGSSDRYLTYPICVDFAGKSRLAR